MEIIRPSIVFVFLHVNCPGKIGKKFIVLTFDCLRVVGLPHVHLLSSDLDGQLVRPTDFLRAELNAQDE